MLFSFSYMSSGGCITVCAKETRLLANFFGHVCPVPVLRLVSNLDVSVHSLSLFRTEMGVGSPKKVK